MFARGKNLENHWIDTRWAPSSYKWSYNPYKWPYKSLTVIGVITGRGPTL